MKNEGKSTKIYLPNLVYRCPDSLMCFEILWNKHLLKQIGFVIILHQLVNTKELNKIMQVSI